MLFFLIFFFFFFNDTATTEIYTLSLHDALPICRAPLSPQLRARQAPRARGADQPARSEEHTSELQSQSNLVCRLLLEKKKKNLTSKCQLPDTQSRIDHDHHRITSVCSIRHHTDI